MTNKELEEENKQLRELLIQNGIIQKDKSKAFSDVKMNYLKELVNINKNLEDNNKFDNWFNNNLRLRKDEINFLDKLLDKYGLLLNSFNEDRLKVVFIGNILEKVDFLNKKLNIGNFYHSPLQFKNDKINFNGFCDFYVANGLEYPETPYFFIQEYKPSIGGSHPEPQLLAELISAIELNKSKTIKGCYIIGAIWNFVILEKVKKDTYQYFVSRDFLSTNENDLKSIYKNSLFVKDEIFNIVNLKNKK